MAIFDRLTAAQKVAMLATVGSALLDPKVPPPELTAVVESTTATILHMYVHELEVEADTNGYAEACAEDGLPPFTDCRSPLLKLLANQLEDTGEDPLPDVSDTDAKRWVDLAGLIFESILYDRDFDDEELYVDSPPDVVEYLKETMAILPDYFTETASEPNRLELRKHLDVLERLTGLSLDEKLVTD